MRRRSSFNKSRNKKLWIIILIIAILWIASYFYAKEDAVEIIEIPINIVK